MSRGKNQHYVPRFLLRGFSSDQRSIGLVNKATRNVINQASIASQCCKDNFNEIALDDALSALETRVAPIISCAAADRGLPPFKTPAHIDLVLFIVLQHGRTSQAREEYKKMSWDLANVAGVDVPSDEKELHAEFLRIHALTAPNAFDLRLAILRNKTSVPFVISDDPVIFHNTLFQSETYRGHAGLRCVGFQAFLPISTNTCLYLYDPSAYTLNAKGSKYVAIGRPDVFNLNRLQFINCKQNIYFDQASGFSAVAELIDLEWDVRKRSEIVEAANDDNELESLFHLFSPPICSDFKLFCSTPKASVARAAKLGKNDRWRSRYLTEFYDFFSDQLKMKNIDYYSFYKYLDWYLANKGQAAKLEFLAREASIKRNPSRRFSVK